MQSRRSIMQDITNNDNIIDPVIDNTGCSYDSVKDIKIYNCVLADDYSNISGYTEDGVKAKYIFKDHRWYYGAEISKLNLITFDKLSEEEHKKYVQWVVRKPRRILINSVP